MIRVRGWLGGAALLPAGLLAVGCGGAVDLDSKRGAAGTSSHAGGASSHSGGAQSTGGSSRSNSSGGSSETPSEPMMGGAPPDQACGAGVGAPSVPQVDAAVSSRYNWSECGRIEPGGRSIQALYASDGSILSLESGGRVRAYKPGGLFGSTLVEAPDRRYAGKGGMSLANHGSRLLTWDDSTAQIYEAQGRAPIGAASGSLSRLATVAIGVAGCDGPMTWSSDGTLLVSQGDEQVCAWQVASGALVTSIAVEPAQDYAATAAGATADGSELRVLRNGALYSFALSGEQKSRVDLPLAWAVSNGFAALSEDAGTLLLIAGLSPAPSTAPVQLLAVDTSTGLERWRQDLVYSPSMQLVRADDGYVVIPGDSIFRITDGQKVAPDPPVYYGGAPTSLSPTVQTKVLSFFQVQEWDLSQKKLVRLYGGHSSQHVSALDISRDGLYLASHDGDDAIVWELNPSFAQSVPRFNGRAPDSSWNVALAPDGGAILVSGDNVASFDRGGAFQGPLAPTASLGGWLSPDWSYSANGCLVAGMHYGSDVEVHDARDMSLRARLTTPTGNAGVAFSPDSSRLMTANLDLFDTSDFSLLWSLGPPNPGTFGSGEYGVDYAPDGSEVVITRCNADGTNQCSATRYDAATGAQLGAVPQLTGDRVRYSPEGHWLVSGNRALHLPTGRSLQYTDDATVALFTPQGDIIAGTSGGSLVRYCRANE